MLSMISTLFLTGCMALPALAQIVPPIEDPVGYLPALWLAIQNGQWLVVGAIVTLILVLLFKKLVLPKIGLGTGILPIVSAIIGVVTGVGLAIMGGAPLAAAAAAVFSGPLAGLLWDALVKYFFKK
jgi:hypothetical protein